MKSFRILFFIFFIYGLLCTCVFSKPIKVFVFLSGAKIVEEEELSLTWDKDISQIKLLLPSQVVKESFDFYFVKDKGIKLKSIEFNKVDLIKNKRIENLKKEIELLYNKKRFLESRLKAIDDFIKAWQKVLDKDLKGSLEFKRLFKDLKTIQDLYNQKGVLDRKIKDIDKKLKALKQKLVSATGGKEGQWEVVIRLFSKKPKDKIKLRYSYFLNEGVALKPVYLIKAYPKKSLVSFWWRIKLTQSTGVDWNDIDLFFITSRAYFRLEPYPIYPWIIKPAEEVVREKRAYFPKALAPAKFFGLKGKPEGKKEERFLFDVYYLGKVSLAAGEKKLFNIKKFSVPCRFTYLIRPLEEEKAYLRTEVTFSKGLRLPQGEGLFWVGESYVGKKRPFYIFGKKAILFFGPDPEIRVKKVLVEKGSGEKGIIRGKKTYKWLWKIIIENNKKIPIKATVEFPYPQLRDERIEQEISINRKIFKKKDKSFIGTLVLNKGEEKSISYGVKITYPKNMNVWWNRF